MDLDLGLILKPMLLLYHRPTEEINGSRSTGVKRHIQSGSVGNLEMEVTVLGRLSL